MSGRLDGGEVRFAGVAIVSPPPTLVIGGVFPLMVSRMMANSEIIYLER